MPDLSYHSHTLAYCLYGESQGDTDLYVMINAFWEDLTFIVQEACATDWRRVVDTSQPSPLDFIDSKEGDRLNSLAYDVKARSVVVLMKSGNDQ